MAYNRRNLLLRAIEVQNITREHTDRGVTQEWVYKNVIFPRLRISKRTYYTYLCTPAKMEIKKLDSAKQMSLFT